MMMKDEAVHHSKVDVYVRCRPLTGKELLGKRCLSVSNEDTIIINDKRFNFKNVFDEYSTQDDIYDICVKSLVKGCFKGYNATVFACNRIDRLMYDYNYHIVCISNIVSIMHYRWSDWIW